FSFRDAPSQTPLRSPPHPTTPRAALGVAGGGPKFQRPKPQPPPRWPCRPAGAPLPRLPDYVLVDGNKLPSFGCRAEALVGGDALSLSIAAASIMAKVVRDRIMARLDVRWPAYGWDRNSGYGTVVHRAALSSAGVTPHHRKTFGTVRRQIEHLAMEGRA
ncbi:ribonuclease HII, partial [Acetobacter persici]|uniref:ribonuclease HII n=1 Tax=Acetobacter persici TaxID=1076596 RepID=UPI0039E97F04